MNKTVEMFWNQQEKKNNIEIQNAVWVFFDVPFL